MNTSKQDRVSMVMERTMFNLNFIKDRKHEKGPYEITQLVNSFLGALSHPWEELKEQFKKMSIRESIQDGWPKIKKELTEDENPENLGHLLRLIRNSIAHGNIKFLPEGDCEIERIHIVNIDPRCKHRTWGAIIETEEMWIFLNKFVDTANALKHNQHSRKLADNNK
jgi:hypothetical protein